MNLFISPDGRLRNGWRFLIAAFAFIVTEMLAGRFAATFVHSYSLRFEALFRPMHLTLLLIAFSLMVKFLDRVHENPLAAQGLGTRGPRLKDVATGLLIGFGLVTIAVIGLGAFGDLSFKLELSGRTIPPALLVVWVLATAAMLEEVAFRGYPFQRLADGLAGLDHFVRMPFGTSAITVLSVLFGAVHLRNPHATLLGAANTALVGVFFSIAYLRTRSLWMPFGLHFGWNFSLGTLFGLPVSGITNFAVVVHGTALGPVWLTGGDYGIEASATGTAVILLGILLLVLFIPTRVSDQISGNSALASNMEGKNLLDPGTCNSERSGQ
ncbi:MAG: Abortive infection protein [Acidobacteriaceae bacterium]|nr:Abortive infection protein [Acidobacteriaceae bacterium]